MPTSPPSSPTDLSEPITLDPTDRHIFVQRPPLRTDPTGRGNVDGLYPNGERGFTIYENKRQVLPERPPLMEESAPRRWHTISDLLSERKHSFHSGKEVVERVDRQVTIQKRIVGVSVMVDVGVLGYEKWFEEDGMERVGYKKEWKSEIIIPREVFGESVQFGDGHGEGDDMGKGRKDSKIPDDAVAGTENGKHAKKERVETRKASTVKSGSSSRKPVFIEESEEESCMVAENEESDIDAA